LDKGSTTRGFEEPGMGKNRISPDKNVEVKNEIRQRTQTKLSDDSGKLVTLRDLAKTDPKKALSQLSVKYATKKREILNLQNELNSVKIFFKKKFL